MLTKKYLDHLTYKIIGVAIEVHKELGPGLLENIYHRCAKKEYTFRDIKFASELYVPVIYKGEPMDAEVRCDVLVEDSIVVEFKTVEALTPLHEAQLLTYMKLLKKPKGVLINFNCTNIFKEGQKTLVNEYYKDLPDE